MRRVGWVVAIVLAAGCIAVGQARTFQGTVIRMRTSECARQHGFVSAMSGVQVVTSETCPEYTVMSEKVVYVLVGRKTDEFIPLAENIIFQVRKNEVVVIAEGEKEEERFAIRQMTLREDWERDEQQRSMMTRMGERNVTYDQSKPHIALRQASSR